MICNAHSLRLKKVEFFNFLKDREIAISAVSETHLKLGDSMYHPLFHTYRLDRENNRSGGGVALTVRRGVTHNLLPCPATVAIEAISVRVSHSSGSFVITSVYFPGSNDPDTWLDYKRDLLHLLSLYPDHVITGDFNSRHSFWGCNRSNRAGRILYNLLCEEHFILHHPHTPTHFPDNGNSPSTLELFLVQGNVNLSDPIAETEPSSDHVPVLGEIGGSGAIFSSTRHVKDYERADWAESSWLLALNIPPAPETVSSGEEIDSLIEQFNTVILEAEAAAVPQKEITPGFIRLPAHVRSLKGQRNAMNRRWQRTGDRYFKNARDDLNRQIQHEISNLTNDRFGSALESINDDPGTFKQKLWRLTKTIRNRPSGIPTLRVGNKRLITDSEKAEALGEHFHKIHEDAAQPNKNNHERRVKFD